MSRLLRRENSMKCAVHPEADATGFCRNCGKAMCSVCARPVREVLYCENCLAQGMGVPTVTPPPTAANPYAAPGYQTNFVPPATAVPPMAGRKPAPDWARTSDARLSTTSPVRPAVIDQRSISRWVLMSSASLALVVCGRCRCTVHRPRRSQGSAGGRPLNKLLTMAAPTAMTVWNFSPF